LLYYYICVYPICYIIKIFFLYKGDFYYLLLLVFNLLVYNIYILYSSIVLLYLIQFGYFSILTLYLYCKVIPPVLHTIQIFKLATTLHIGFLNIHPILLYTVCVIGLGSALYIESYKWIHIPISVVVLVALSALLFGMYWGVFSFLWGFFWVNDLVEWFLLVLILLLLALLHNSYTLHFKSSTSFYIIFLLLYITAIRLNLLFTRHSFFFNFFINNLLLYFLIFSLTYSIEGLVVGFIYYLLWSKLYSIYALLYIFFFNIIKVHSIFLELPLMLLLLHYSIFLFILTWGIKQAYYLAFFYSIIKISYSSTYYLYINYFSSYSLYLYYTTYKIHSSLTTLTTFTLYSWFYNFIIFYKVELSLFFLLYFYLIYIIWCITFQISKIRLIWV
jgi:hypothetical protein